MKEINIGKKLIEKRKEKGITQENLANYIGVSKASVSKWEIGQSYPDILLLPRLAAYFNISIDELMDYAPQMEGAEICKLYHKLCAEFTKKSFDIVMTEVHEILKKYYSCFPLLFQMATLMLNHYMLANSTEIQISVLEEAMALCQRIKAESEDAHLIKQSNSLEAAINMILQRPSETIDLLDNNMAPLSADEMLLASAYQLCGDTVNAKKILQISCYQYVLMSIGASTQMLSLYVADRNRFNEILRRNEALIRVYQVDKLQPNVSFQLHMAAALGFISLEEDDKAIEYLGKAISIFKGFSFPLSLHGDDYFDLLDGWFENFPLGTDAPRHGKIIKENILVILSDQRFSRLFKHPEYKTMVESLKRMEER